MTILDRARPNIRNLQPYVSARMDKSTGILLNANENPWCPDGLPGALNRYPAPQPADAVTALSQLYGCDSNQMLVTRGSDEGIDLLTRAFCEPAEDAILISPPTFGMYRVAARIQNVDIVEAPLDPETFQLRHQDLINRVREDRRIKLVYVCSPNNPTGNIVSPSALRDIASAARHQAVVVVDEAYMEFSKAPSAISFLDEFDNIAILRTLSKAHALAGARVGTLIAHREVIELVGRIISPYPVPTTTAQAITQALSADQLHTTSQRIQQIVAMRDELRQALALKSCVERIHPSDANFLLCRFHEVEAVLARLRSRGVLIRDFSGVLSGAARVTVGTAEENHALLEALP